MVSSNFPNYPYRLEENVWLRYQDIGGNFSNYGGELWIRKNSGTGRWTANSNSSFTFHLNGGQVAGWNFSYDFRTTDALRLCYVEVNIGHNADGTKYFSIDGYCNAEQLGYTEVHSGLTAPTIPRASTLTFTSPDMHSGAPGVAWSVNTNRASGSFTHDIDYYFGNASGRAMTGIGQTGTWTPSWDLMNQIPNTTTGVGKLRTHTYNGGSMIGWTETPFRLTIPASAIPTWTSAVVEEATAGLSAIIGTGVYLQGISTLKGTITGAAGVYGSTITSQTHAAGGETVSGATATFTRPISTAGTAVPVTQTVTDTRGRQKVQTTNLNVLPYSRPIVSNLSVDRVNASNALDPVGTRLRIGVTGVVQSIVNSTQRNRLTLRVATKPRASSTWSAFTNIIVDSSTLTYNSNYYLVGPFSVATAYDVKVELVDKFNTTVAQTQVGTGEIFQHWSDGLGVGKYWERGTVDAIKQMYQRDGKAVLDERMLFGTTADRDAYFGTISTVTQQVAIANARPLWFNTEYGWWETYYMTVGTSGLTVPGLVNSGLVPPGWYPIAEGPWVIAEPTAAFAATANNYVGGWNGSVRGTNNNSNFFEVLSSGLIKCKMAGLYDVDVWTTQQTGTGTANYHLRALGTNQSTIDMAIDAGVATLISNLATKAVQGVKARRIGANTFWGLWVHSGNLNVHVYGVAIQAQFTIRYVGPPLA
jgi:hypothetical protein